MAFSCLLEEVIEKEKNKKRKQKKRKKEFQKGRSACLNSKCAGHGVVPVCTCPTGT